MLEEFMRNEFKKRGDPMGIKGEDLYVIAKLTGQDVFDVLKYYIVYIDEEVLLPRKNETEDD